MGWESGTGIVTGWDTHIPHQIQLEIWFPADADLRRQQMMAQGLGTLLLTTETWEEF